MNKLMRAIRNPSLIPKHYAKRIAVSHVVGDATALRLQYWAVMGSRLNLDNPRTFNEKLQWLKLHDRNPLYTTLVDKYAVKQWVAERIGEQYVVPTYGVWDRFDDIDFDTLPERFVLKCTHDSGGLAICRDRANFDVAAAREKIEASLKRNYYWSAREWPYKDVPPRIIAEEYLEAADGSGDLADYKYFCFSGEAKAMFVATNRFGEGETRFDFFDMEWRHLPFTNGHPNADFVPARPAAFEEMRRMAERLSEGIPHVRVDFYEARGGTYFGEMTFSHWGGLVPFDPPEWDEAFGSWIDLPGGGLLVGDGWIVWLHEGTSGLEESVRHESGDLPDYKLFRFSDGRLVTLVCEDRLLGAGMSKTFFDEGWHALDLSEGGHPTKSTSARPAELGRMMEFARALGEGLPFVRVDFYESAGGLYFGEMTLYPNAGFERFDPTEWDEVFGSWIELPGVSPRS